MRRHRKRLLAFGGVLLLAAGGVAAFATFSPKGQRLDDRTRDGNVCGTGDEDNQCPGAVEMTVVPNPRLHEYAVIWQGWYTGSMPDGVRLYGRRFDATTGQPKGPSIELAQSGLEYPFAAAYDFVTRTYVLGWQLEVGPYSAGQVYLQRLDETLRPRSSARQLAGSWTLKTLTPEAGGRVAVTGVEHEQAFNGSPLPGIGLLTLHVETIDANDRTLLVTRREAEATGFAEGVSATYDSDTRSLLVAWIPAFTQQGAHYIRIDGVDASGAGTFATLPITPGVPVWQTNLACNPLRGDCLLLYAGGGPPPADLHARLLADNGRPRSDLVVAHNTHGPIGAGATGSGYTFAWTGGAIVPPATSHVVGERLEGSPPQVTHTFDENLPGKAWLAVGGTPTASLLAWLRPVDHPQWSQIRGEIVR